MAIRMQRFQEEERSASVRKPIVPAVEQACRILLCLGENQKKMKLSEISKQLGMHRGKVYAILQALVPFGFVEKDGAKTYSVGPAHIFLGRSFLDNLSYPDIVEPLLEDLAGETNATAVFGFISGDHIFVAAKGTGNQRISFTLPIGHRVPLTLGAHGKAIAAFMPEDERKKMLSGKRLYFYGDKSRLDKKRLQKEIAQCRELGFARDVGEVTPGVNVVSAPVFGVGERIIGCITLFGTFHQELTDALGQKVAKVAAQLSFKIGANLKQI